MNNPLPLLKKINKLDRINKVKLFKAQNELLHRKALVKKTKVMIKNAELAIDDIKNAYSSRYLENNHVFDSYINSVEQKENELVVTQSDLINKSAEQVIAQAKLLGIHAKSKLTEKQRANVNIIYQKFLLEIENKDLDIKR